MGLIQIAKRIIGIEKESRGFRAETEQLPAYVGTWGQQQPIGRGTYQDYLDTYSYSPWVFVCVNRISCSLSQVPIKLWKRKPGKEREEWAEVVDEKNDLYRLLSKPNPYMTQSEFIEAIAAALELVGNAYVEIVYANKDGEEIPVEMYPLLPYRIKIAPDIDTYIGGFIYDVPKGKVLFDYDEIIHFKYNNPKDQFYGHAPMRIAENSVIVDLYSTTYNKNFFRNSAVPEGVLETEQTLDPDVLRRTRRAWSKYHQGVSKAHSLAILEQGLKYSNITTSAKDMQFVQQKKLNREEILAIWGVPPILAGIMEFANYSNAIEQWKQYWSETITPKLKKLQDRLNHDLAPKFKDPNLYIEFDTDAITAMRSDKESEARIDASYTDRGIFTINDIRRKKGYKTVPWGDEWWMPMNLQQVGGMQGMELGPGPKGDIPSPDQPTKFPSQQKGMFYLPASYVLKRLTSGAEEDPELSPFQRRKLLKRRTKY